MEITIIILSNNKYVIVEVELKEKYYKSTDLN